METKTRDLWSLLTSLLPHYPTGKRPDYWSDQDLILCPSLDEANVLADVLEAVGFDPVTGYFDPAVDDEWGTRDKYTGYAYVDLN